MGNAEAHCTSSGQWDHPLPACVPWPCSSPPVPQDGSIETTFIGEDDIIAVVQCRPGFELSQHSGNLTCGAAGHWMGTVQCVPEICSDPAADFE